MTPAELEDALDAFGRAVRLERQRRVGSIAHLASRVPELSDAMLGAIERGSRRPTLGRALAIADALGVPMSVLLEENPHRAVRCAACQEDGAHARRHRELEAVTA